MKSRRARYLFGRFICLTVAGLCACGSPAADTPAGPTIPPTTITPEPATPEPATPTGRPVGEAFTSPRFGYTFLYPPGWLVKDRPGDWADYDPLDPNRGAGIDAFAAYLDGRNLALGIGARPLPDGSTLESWTETAKTLIGMGLAKACAMKVARTSPRPPSR
ncbi:MAG: photosystem II reaction center PsbP family protein [Chloroflexi bacterium]|nr:photosystem II reaction center PsbP family protein [Chloroflexota bacterium]MCI0576904.1 photosystem II reaction center PsbP family protein [Chloroflexota bacterium]MCI0646442.1 photosystem II reaction center PsbP family protein [Chloroflexota bacterium]MCI0731410.1 photosystem II reaction center PsbP family protein [Chloroflexota bacterium]